MTLQQIGYFLKLAEECNYTSVAKLFFITQPTLSKQIVNLENELNITLFIREHGKVKLTDSGKMFYDQMKPLFVDMMEVIRKTQDQMNARDFFRIGIQDEQMISNSLMLAVDQFRHEYPGLQVSIERADTEALLAGLEAGKYDVLNMMKYPMGPSRGDTFEFLLLEQEATYFAISRQLVQGDDVELTAENLNRYFEEYSLLLPDIYEDFDDTIPKKLFVRNYDVVEEKINLVRAGSLNSVPVQVAARLGVSICNETSLMSIDPEIKLIKISGSDNTFQKGLYYTKQPNSPYLKKLLRIVRKNI